jgi:hypothetical protein
LRFLAVFALILIAEGKVQGSHGAAVLLHIANNIIVVKISLTYKSVVAYTASVRSNAVSKQKILICHPLRYRKL